MINIGLLGCGRIGVVHARSIAQLAGARVVGVADAVTAAADALADRIGARVMESNALIADGEIDAVVIATPTDTHYDLIQAAASSRKAIFCEKPVDMSADRIRECIAAVTAAGVPFLTAFNRRFDPNFANLQKRLSEGEIGDPEIVTILSRDPAPPSVSYIESSGGIFRDMMIHDFDMARFLLGEEPVQVFAVGSALVDPQIRELGDADTAAVTLTTASGRLCQISNSRRATYGYDQRIEVHGSRGMLRAANVVENTVEAATADGFRIAPAKRFFLERYEEAYRSEMEHFIRCVGSGGSPSPGIEDGLRAQIIADAAMLSWQTGQPINF